MTGKMACLAGPWSSTFSVAKIVLRGELDSGLGAVARARESEGCRFQAGA